MANKLTKLITKWSVVPRANLGRSIAGKQLPTLLYVTCCVRLHTLLHVVGSCCAKFESGQTFSYVQTDAASLLRPFARSLTLIGTC